MEYFEFLLGWFLGIVSLIIAEVIGYLFTKRNMKTEHEYSERMLRTQLYQEDKKKALVELDEMLRKKYNTFQDFEKAVESFLDGSSGIFLPEKLKEELRNEVRGVSAFLSKKIEEFYGPTPEIPDDYEDWIEAVSPDEEIDAEVEARLRGLKSKMRGNIRKYVSE
jgi:hypothetical protein